MVVVKNVCGVCGIHNTYCSCENDLDEKEETDYVEFLKSLPEIEPKKKVYDSSKRKEYMRDYMRKKRQREKGLF